MNWPWFMKLYFLALSVAVIAGSVMFTSQALFGVALLLAAWHYDWLDALQQRHLVPPCLERFPEHSRHLLEAKYSQPLRVVLAILGLANVVGGLWGLPGPSILEIPPVVVGIWLIVGSIYLAVTEFVRVRWARASETFEQYHTNFTASIRWIFIFFYAVAMVTSYAYLT